MYPICIRTESSIIPCTSSYNRGKSGTAKICRCSLAVSRHACDICLKVRTAEPFKSSIRPTGGSGILRGPPRDLVREDSQNPTMSCPGARPDKANAHMTTRNGSARLHPREEGRTRYGTPYSQALRVLKNSDSSSSRFTRTITTLARGPETGSGIHGPLVFQNRLRQLLRRLGRQDPFLQTLHARLEIIDLLVNWTMKGMSAVHLVLQSLEVGPHMALGTF